MLLSQKSHYSLLKVHYERRFDFSSVVLSIVNDLCLSFSHFQESRQQRFSSPSLAWQACSSASLGIDSSNVVSGWNTSIECIVICLNIRHVCEFQVTRFLF